MKTWIAILFTIGLLAADIVISALIRFPLTWFMVLGTALWAAIDSKKIQLKRYKSGISYGPVVLFIAIAFLWIIGFPWYLAMRYKIKTGTAVLKDEAPKVAA
jgi:membrane protein YdbS with pleckstrin-like domain